MSPLASEIVTRKSRFCAISGRWRGSVRRSTFIRRRRESRIDPEAKCQLRSNNFSEFDGLLTDSAWGFHNGGTPNGGLATGTFAIELFWRAVSCTADLPRPGGWAGRDPSRAGWRRRPRPHSRRGLWAASKYALCERRKWPVLRLRGVPFARATIPLRTLTWCGQSDILEWSACTIGVPSGARLRARAIGPTKDSFQPLVSASAQTSWHGTRRRGIVCPQSLGANSAE